jgi:hypothetical protein
MGVSSMAQWNLMKNVVAKRISIFEGDRPAESAQKLAAGLSNAK